jgi:HK97 family phage major capsid protein
LKDNKMTTFVRLNYSQAVERMENIHARMEQLGAKHRMSRADDEEFDELSAEFKDLDGHVKSLQRAAEMAKGGGRFSVEHGSQGRDDDVYAGDRGVRDTAMRALDRVLKADRLGTRGAELVEQLMCAGPLASQSWTQRWAAATGSEHYERAFAKKLADPDNGQLLWTREEADAWRDVANVQAEQRSMSLTDNQGGYLVPLVIDPAIQLTSAGSTNPLRQISRVVQTVSDSWNGVTSAGVTAEWTAEAAEVADASPTLAQPTIPVYKGDAFVPFSFEVGGDAMNFMGELTKLLADGADQLTATAYTTGSGTGQPTGVISALAGGASAVAPATPETLAAADIYAVQNALPPRFQPNASWNANLSIINTLRQMETSNGALKFPGLQSNPPNLLGRTMYENSNMDGTLNAAATENNYPLLYGDFGQGFVIVDRIGSTLELVPHLFGSNRRPTGQRGALLWFRTGSNVVVANAFRMLSIPTAA